MTRTLSFIILSILIILPLSLSTTQKPKALVLPISKDPITLQYITHLRIGTPFVSKSLVVDLDNRYLWLDCANGYHSSTYRSGFCGSAACSASKSQGCGLCVSSSTLDKPGCAKNKCDLVAINSVSGHSLFGNLAIDRISLQSTNGSNPLSHVQIPGFMFSCVNDTLLTKLPEGVKGMIGLGRHPAGLSSQLSSQNFRKKFAICLPSKKSNGVLFFGESPYVFFPNYNTSKAVDVSSRFTYTRLLINPVSNAVVSITGEPSADYFVGLTSILVDDKPILLNSTLLKFNKWGQGGTMISTTTPYTILESSIYKSLVSFFDERIISRWKVTKVDPVAPFGECYTMGNLGMSLLGLSVPDISFVFENKNVKWDVFGANSMVEISKDVICLGFVDGGVDIQRSIVIGSHMLEDNLLQFDLAASKLGFTSSLILADVECSNFNFN